MKSAAFGAGAACADSFAYACPDRGFAISPRGCLPTRQAVPATGYVLQCDARYAD
jgi:hypothetical protein